VSQRNGSGALTCKREVRADAGLNTRTPTTQMLIKAATALLTRAFPSRVGEVLNIRGTCLLLTQLDKPVYGSVGAFLYKWC